MNLMVFGLIAAYGIDSGAVVAASVFMTIRILSCMTKMVWSRGGHIKQSPLYMQNWSQSYFFAVVDNNSQ